jgi:hypothetical protein
MVSMEMVGFGGASGFHTLWKDSGIVMWVRFQTRPLIMSPKGLHEQFQRYCEGPQERINVWSCCICIILAAAVREDGVNLAQSEFVCVYFKRDFFFGCIS